MFYRAHFHKYCAERTAEFTQRNIFLNCTPRVVHVNTSVQLKAAVITVAFRTGTFFFKAEIPASSAQGGVFEIAIWLIAGVEANESAN